MLPFAATCLRHVAADLMSIAIAAAYYAYAAADAACRHASFIAGFLAAADAAITPFAAAFYTYCHLPCQRYIRQY